METAGRSLFLPYHKVIVAQKSPETLAQLQDQLDSLAYEGGGDCAFCFSPFGESNTFEFLFLSRPAFPQNMRIDI